VTMPSGDGTEALAAYQESLDIGRKLAAQDPGNAEAQRDAFVSLTKVASMKLANDDRDTALSFFKQALSIAERLEATDTSNPQARSDLVWIRQRISPLEDVSSTQEQGTGSGIKK